MDFICLFFFLFILQYFASSLSMHSTFFYFLFVSHRFVPFRCRKIFNGLKSHIIFVCIYACKYLDANTFIRFVSFSASLALLVCVHLLCVCVSVCVFYLRICHNTWNLSAHSCMSEKYTYVRCYALKWYQTWLITKHIWWYMWKIGPSHKRRVNTNKKREHLSASKESSAECESRNLKKQRGESRMKYKFE